MWKRLLLIVPLLVGCKSNAEIDYLKQRLNSERTIVRRAIDDQNDFFMREIERVRIEMLDVDESRSLNYRRVTELQMKLDNLEEKLDAMRLPASGESQ